MSLPWRSQFIYGEELEFEASLSARPWTPSLPSVGGSIVAASGVPASYVVRWDSVLVLPLRFYESEWAALESLVKWGQASEILEWKPDVDEESSYLVYLESPRVGEVFLPTRNSRYPKMFEAEISLRRVDGQTWNLFYFE